MKPTFLLALAAAAASAGPPAQLAGTTWAVQANRDAEQLIISHQGGPGTPGAATCPPITGTIGAAPISGWYCPATGRIHFVHSKPDNGATLRLFTGNLSDALRGQTLYMGGTMTVVNPAYGPAREYNFAASN